MANAATNGAILNQLEKRRETDLDRLSRLKDLSWLSTPQLSLLVSAFALANFKRRDIILREAALASEVNILLTGIARITCMNARVTAPSDGPSGAARAPKISGSSGTATHSAGRQAPGVD